MSGDWGLTKIVERWSFAEIKHPPHHQWHPIPSPTTSWSWPFFPSTSYKWRCYLPKIPLTNPTCERRTVAHRSSQSTSVPIPKFQGSKRNACSSNHSLVIKFMGGFLANADFEVSILDCHRIWMDIIQSFTCHHAINIKLTTKTLKKGVEDEIPLTNYGSKATCSIL